MEFNNKIKIIFWDLDYTLWKGAIAETEPQIYHNLFKKIQKLNEFGIMNSIVSHNNFDIIKDFLIKLGYWNLFIFPKISWKKKAPQIMETLDQMHLRGANALFIDDRQHNLDEAKYYIKEIMVLNPIKNDVNFLLDDIIVKFGKEDNLKRYDQYKVLEKKTKYKNKKYINDEFSFLKKSKIKIFFETPKDHIERIYEIVSRTNQLNYTKNRDSKEDLLKKINDLNYKNFVISVNDKFGDYGIVGFISFKEDVVQHFVFSCRILNMGIESFLFYYLNVPSFNYNGEVSYSIYDYKPDWIEVIKEKKKKTFFQENDTIMVGGCDLSQMEIFFDKKLCTHFNYVSKENSKLMIHRDSIDFLLFENLNFNSKQKKHIIKTCPFIDDECFNVPNFNEFNTIIYSPLIDYIQGKYISKNTLIDESFFLSCNPFLFDNVLDEEKISFMKKEYNIESFQIKEFFQNWKYVEKPIEHYKKQLIVLFDKFIHASVFVLLGATNTYSDLDKDKFIKHKKMNNIIKDVGKKYNNIIFIEPDKFISSREDFINSIRHYKKNVYYKMFLKIFKHMDGGCMDE